MSISLAQAFDPAVPAGSTSPDDPYFEELYRSFHPRLVRMLQRRTPDAALAEDIAQETLLRAFMHRGVLDAGRPMWPWLKTIATRLLIDHARCKGREVLCDPEPEASVDELEAFDEGLLYQAMRKLTGSQKVAVSLRYLDGWQPAEAAKFLGINRLAFEQLLLRARRRLRVEYTRLSEKTLAGLLFPYRQLKGWAIRMNQRVGEPGTGITALGGAGVNAATQITSGVLALITAATVVAASPTTDTPLAGTTHYRGAPSHAAPSARYVSETQPVAGGLPPRDGGEGSTAGEHDSPGAQAQDVVNKLTDPNEGIQQPEDTRITSIAFGPNGPGGRTVYAIGQGGCGLYCESVLFESSDGGASWRRLRATGLRGDTIIVPSVGNGHTIFAMGTAGLQVSRNGGQTFTFAYLAGSPLTVGSAAVSPEFFRGDPTVLIGSQTLMRYRDDTGAVEPYPAALVGGPFAPVYSPTYATDRRIFVGGIRIRAQQNRKEASVYTCSLTVCREAVLHGTNFAPQIRTANRFDTEEVVLAFGAHQLYASRDGGKSFSEIALPDDVDGSIADAAFSDDGRLVISTAGLDGRALLISPDWGTTWERPSSPLFERGGKALATVGSKIIVALGRRGLACSLDNGRTWASRCDGV